MPSLTTQKTTFLLLLTLTASVYLLRSQTHSYQNAVSVSSTPTTPDDITASICGSFSSDSPYTQGEIDRAATINQFLSQLRNGNPILNFALSGQNPVQFGEDYAENLIPFAAFGAVMLLFSLFALCFYCCDPKCLRLCASPTQRKKRGYAIMSFIICLIMGGVSVTGWIFARDLSNDYQRTSCSGAGFIADFSRGIPSQNWIGLSPAIANLTDINDKIVQTLDLLPNIPAIHQRLDHLHNQLKVQIQDYYKNNYKKTVSNPIPTQPALQPQFMQSLGPPSDMGTISGAMFEEVTLKYQAINVGLHDSNSSIEELKDQANNINSVLEEGIGIANALNDNVTSILTEYSQLSQSGQNVNQNLADGIEVFFIFCAVLAILFLFGIINVFMVKHECCFSVLRCSRYILNTLLIVGFFTSIMVFPALITAMETCNATNVALNNETIFTGYAKTFSPNFKENGISTYTHTCLFSDGNILANFGIDQQMTYLDTIFDKMQNMSNYYNFSIPDSYVIPIEEDYIQLFITGKLPISVMLAEELIGLNQYTNSKYSSSLYQCSESQDTWYLNSINCTASDGYVFTADKPADFNYGYPTCIGFDQFAKYQSTDRYQGKYKTCPNSRGFSYELVVSTFVAGFQDHLKDVAKVFDEVGTDLNKINDTNRDFMQEGRGLVEPLLDIDNRAFEILNMVGNNKTGLVSNFNCAFLKNNAQNVVDHLCVSYLPDLFIIAVCILLFGILALIAMFPVFLLEKMHKVEKRENGNLEVEVPGFTRLLEVSN